MKHFLVCNIFFVLLFQLLHLSLHSLDCDDEYVCQGSTLSDSSYVRCRALSSCRDATNITSTGSFITCDAQRSCQDSGPISSASYLVCRSVYSCYGAGGLTASTYILCEGLYSCWGFYGILAGTYVECQGQNSCSNNTFITATSSYVTCEGYRSCYDINKIGISASSTIYCRGYQSCILSKLISANDGVSCAGTESCEYTLIEGIQNITGYGENALNYANISSTNSPNNMITVNLYGWKSGINLRITCDAGDICYINCNGNGCFGTELIGNYGTFVVNCDESMNIDCPINYYGPTDQPTFYPTIIPSPYPTENPTDTPTDTPTDSPTDSPTESPTDIPTDAPTDTPTHTPTDGSTDSPTNAPTDVPTKLSSTIASADTQSSENDSSNDTYFWIIIILIIIIFVSITIIIGLIIHNKGIKTQLQSTKEMLLSEQSEMIKALTNKHGSNNAINIASNMNGLSTNSIIPQQASQHANIIQQWANTNNNIQQPSHHKLMSQSQIRQIPRMIPQIEMSTLEAQKRYYLEMANALDRVGSSNNVDLNEGNNNGEIILPQAPKINNNAIINHNSNNHNYNESEDNVDIVYDNTSGITRQGE